MKKIILSLVYALIAVGLTYVSSSSYILPFLVEKGILGIAIDTERIKELCLFASMVFAGVFLPVSLCKAEIQRDNAIDQRNQLLKMTKNNFGITLERFSSNFSGFEIRFFIPKHPVLYSIEEKLGIKHKKEFIIKNIDIIANQGATKGLSFEVSPNSQGLVGECYRQKSMVYDDMLAETNSINYSLQPKQLSRTSNLRWSICCPIIDEKDNVVAIMAFDGTKPITIKKEKTNELADHILTFSRVLYDAVPQMFRR